jgi:hypothetical protein
MADLVELAAEGVDRLVDSHHFDKSYDKGYDVYRKFVNGKQVESTVTPYDREKDEKRRESTAGAQSNAKDTSPRASQAGGNSREVRSSAAGGAPSGGPESHHDTAPSTVTAAQTSLRRKQRNELPSPERDNFASTAIPAAAVGAAAAAGAYTYNNTRRNGEFERQSSISDQVLREYEREADDPTRRAEKVLSPSQLNKIPRSSTVKSSKRGPRRDSAMTSRYADDYQAGSQYAGSQRPRSQPPRSRYDDDGDSDYDEKSGRRSRNNGRGYDDREYDRVIEETERYRGPVGAGPLVVRVTQHFP